ncbi:MAG: gliding motility-associated C-terminal domain-containing protein [Bacteroidales bacterium]|nr:gliding motility-associated C-terminal domain-containing protein [Bacteroidales bacterium]
MKRLILAIALITLSFFSQKVISQPNIIPQIRTICSGENTSYRVTTSISDPIYQWQADDGSGFYDLNEGGAFQGVTTDTLYIINANTGLDGFNFRCLVNSSISDTASLFVNPAPIVSDHPLNAATCKNNSATFTVTAIGGDQYQWQENDLLIGWRDLENGGIYQGVETSQLSISNVFLPMDGFMYRCVVSNDNCMTISDSAELTVYPLPQQYELTGGGSYCEDGNGVEVGLSGSETGINYELFLDESSTNTYLTGTGEPLSFGLQTEPGEYTVQALNNTTECNNLMSGSASVSIDPLPQAFSVTGGGALCEGEPGVYIGLANSETGINYELYKNGNPTGVIRLGNNSELNFGLWNEEGTYTIEGENGQTGCTTMMEGQTSISINQLPAVFSVTGGGDICEGADGVSIGLDNSEPGITYELYYDGGGTGTTIEGTGNAIEFPPQSLEGEYTVYAFNSNTNCSVAMQGTASILVNELPVPFDLTGGGFYCENGEGIEIGLENSEEGVNYQLLHEGEAIGEPVTGSGNAISFGLMTGQGSYAATATNPETGCENEMKGSVNISINPAPTAYDLSGGATICEGEEGPLLELSASDFGFIYKVIRDGYSTGYEVNGTGNSLNFGNWNEEGTYSVLAVNEETGCSQTMNGTAEIIVSQNPVANAGPDISIPYGNQATLNGSASGGAGNYQYQWAPGSILNDPTLPDPTTNPLSHSVLFRLHVTDENGCQSQNDTALVVVTGNTLEATALANPDTTCMNSPVQLYAIAGGGSGNYAYEWSSNPEGFSSESQNPIAYPQETTTYYVTIDDGPEEATDSITVAVKEPPVSYTVIGGGNYCSGGTGLPVGLNDSENGIYYELYLNGISTGNVRVGNGESITFGLQKAEGQYTVKANDISTACFSDMNGFAAINTDERPVADAGNDVTIPYGSSTLLSGAATGGSGNYTYTWQPEALVIRPDSINTPTVSLTESTDFEFTVTDTETNCQSNADKVNISVTGSSLHVETKAVPDSICAGGISQLYAIVNGGSGAYEYTWHSLPSGFISSDPNPEVSPEVTTRYALTVHDGNHTVMDTVMVNVMELPHRYLVTGGGEFCEGGLGVNIGLSSSQTNVYYSLKNNNTLEKIIKMGTGNALNFGTVSEPGMYTVEASYVNGICSQLMKGTAIITKIPSPVANAGEDQLISNGETAQLSGSVTNGSNSYIYDWEPADMLNDPTLPNPTTVPLQETTLFTFSATDAITGCNSESDSLVIFVEGGALSLRVMASPDTLCAGETVQLLALPSGGTGNYSYEWSSEPPGFSSTKYNPVAYPDETTTYYVTVDDGENTLDSSITVEVNGLPVADAGPDRITSYGSGTQLLGSASGGSGNYIYNWEPEGLLFQPNEPQPFTVPLANDQDFTLVVTDQFSGCESEPDEVTVTVNGSDLTVEALAAPPLSCAGEKISLFALAEGGTGDYEYTWTSDPEGFSAVVFNPVAYPQTPTTYYVSIHDGYESTTDSIEVTVNELPQKFELSNGGSYCPGEDGVEITLSGSEKGAYYRLYYNGTPTNQVKNGKGISLSFGKHANPGTYTVEAFNNTSACNVLMNGSATINTGVLPEQFTVMGGGHYCEGTGSTEIYLAGSEVGTEYILKLNDNKITSLNGTGVEFSFGKHIEEGVYQVVAYSETGCKELMPGNPEIIMDDAPERYTLTGGGEFCEGDAGQPITLDQSDEGVQYYLLKDGEETGSVLSGGESLYFGMWEQSGIYTIEAKIPETGCSTLMANELEIIQHPLPDLEIEDKSERTLITVYPQTLAEYVFIHNGNILQQGTSNTFYYGDAGLDRGDTITVVGTTTNGCSELKQTTINITSSTNAFTPNGDGINDIFMKGVDIAVFNRWGLKIYEGTGGWDGTHEGSRVAPGTYYYIYYKKGPQGQVSETIKGSVTVVYQK